MVWKGSGADPATTPWENAYVETFLSRVRDELLNREIFFTLKEAQVMLERFRVD